jgi:hypothetical protein
MCCYVNKGGQMLMKRESNAQGVASCWIADGFPNPIPWFPQDNPSAMGYPEETIGDGLS